MSRIAEVECVHLRFEYDMAKTFRTPAGPVHGRFASLVRMRTDDGLEGIGSAYAHPGVVQASVDHMAPFLIGLAPDDVGRLADRLNGVSRWYGRKGGALAAISGIDTALWDLNGKRLGQPVWKLLGGREGRAPAYASGNLYSSPEAVADGVRRALARGFRRVKMRVGWTYDYDVAAMRAARAAMGPDHDLMIDGTQRFTVERALDLAPVLAEVNAFWFEEPFGPDDLDSYVALRERLKPYGVRLATGENEFGLHGFRELLRAGAIDIAQADASRAGGITEVMEVGRMAAAHGALLAPHTWCDAVAVVANAHVVAASPNGLTCEVDQTGNRFIEELVGPLPIRDGMLELGDRPGLGITLDEDLVRELRVDPFSMPDGNYCDVIFGRGQTRYIGDYVPKAA
ncbi:MAG: mandelate racemase/muconate lactonizing enzyme family protein [Phenylobacterium sp.]|uniref:mandelate racemase/muconate lactonizing enzyme family protein n=1 Tax=Phenylobacterium sp. TaxID=1871053 RepID=UPI001A5537C7|nr:mandelate racemase/muconate lactonizing enzyme family protein [Phenylobacterium sp.]MBL8553983.1 mandelate racemase/muconate lactonizing enzyme family protein [Phenylobacterium sp.]